MKMNRGLACVLLTASGLWAADSFTPLNVKPGQWEASITTETSGLPPIPPEALARLTPEQRAQMEAVMKGRSGQPRTTVSKSCVQPDDIKNPLAFANEQRTCKPTIVSSSSTKEEIRVDCAEPNQPKTSGTIKVEAVSSELIKISMQMTSSDGNRTMNFSMNGTSKWLGPACTNNK